MYPPLCLEPVEQPVSPWASRRTDRKRGGAVKVSALAINVIPEPVDVPVTYPLASSVLSEAPETRYPCLIGRRKMSYLRMKGSCSTLLAMSPLKWRPRATLLELSPSVWRPRPILLENVTIGVASSADLAGVVTVGVTSSADLAGDVTVGVVSSADLAGVVTVGVAPLLEMRIVISPPVHHL